MQSSEITVNLDIDQAIRGLAKLHDDFSQYQHKQMMGGGNRNNMAIMCQELDTLYGLIAGNSIHSGELIGRIAAKEALVFYAPGLAVWDIRISGNTRLFVRPFDAMPKSVEGFYDKFMEMLKDWAGLRPAGETMKRHPPGRKARPEYDRAFRGFQSGRYTDLREAFDAEVLPSHPPMEAGEEADLFEAFNSAMRRRRNPTK